MPAHSTPARSGDSASVVIVPKWTTPSLRDKSSLAVLPKIGVASRFTSSLVVRSGETSVQVSPRSREPNSLLPP